MRAFAWCLVVAGLVLAIGSFVYADRESERLYDLWLNREMTSMDPARIAAVERLLHDQLRQPQLRVRPTAVLVSPWPGVIAGGSVTALGIIVLAIRRPAPR